MTVNFQLHKINNIKYELRCGDTVMHGNNNHFYKEIEAVQYYEAWVSGWGSLDLMFDSKYKTQEEILNNIGRK